MIHHRHSIRLPKFDYTSVNVYFVTMCVREKECLFGEIDDGEMRVNEVGRIVEEELLKTPMIRKEIELDEWVVMPNHVHFIIRICPVPVSLLVGAQASPRPLAVKQAFGIGGPPSGSLGAIIGQIKSITTKRIRLICPYFEWQRNYYEHIIRTEEGLSAIQQYIRDNPRKWQEDIERPRIFPIVRRG